MVNESYFTFDDDDKMEHDYSHNHEQKGQLINTTQYIA